MVGVTSLVPKIILALLTLAVVAAPVITASTSTASFSPFNDRWDGTSELRSMAAETGTRVVIGHRTTAYREVRANRTAAFVLSPESSYQARDVTRLKEFVRTGGTLVVAGDFGRHANNLLRALNASARLNGTLIRDPRSNYRSAALPVTTDVTNHSLTAGVESLTLNYGTTVDPRDATVLVNTSRYGYLDADGNGRLGANESLGHHPVATVESVGEGWIVVVSDPSVFVNAMLDRSRNRQFTRGLLTRHDTLLLDYSRTSGIPPLVLTVLFVRESAALQFGVGVLVVVALGVVFRRPDRATGLLAAVLRRWRTDDPKVDDVRASPSELADYLEREHPDWDRERVERVAEALERRRR